MRRADAGRRAGWSRSLTVAAVALLSGATLAAHASVATQASQPPATWVAFDVVATADGGRVTAFVPGGPLNDRVFDMGIPKSQTRFDGLGTSAGYAAALYPDELVLNVPGIASGALKTDVPAYPLIATSSHPAKPAGSLDGGGVVLQSSSGRDGSSAVATAGATGTITTGSETVASSVRQPDGTLVAKASSTLSGIAVGPLTIGRLTSTATITRRLDGTVTRVSSAVVTGALVAGQAVTIDRRGLVAADPARAALAAAGLTVRWLDEVSVPAGVTSPALEITQAVPASLTGSGRSTVTTTFGRAAAFATGTAGVSTTAPDTVPDVPCCGPTPEPSPVDGRDGASPTVADDVAATISDGPVPAPVPGASDLGAPVAVAGSPVARVGPETWPVGWYVVLIGAAALVALAAVALHILGVRTTWGS